MHQNAGLVCASVRGGSGNLALKVMTKAACNGGGSRRKYCRCCRMARFDAFLNKGRMSLARSHAGQGDPERPRRTVGAALRAAQLASDTILEKQLSADYTDYRLNKDCRDELDNHSCDASRGNCFCVNLRNLRTNCGIRMMNIVNLPNAQVVFVHDDPEGETPQSRTRCGIGRAGD